jgi:formylmethanofuran dehydrogenase subunit E-like metal-binding protein
LVGDTVNRNNRMYKMDTLRNEVARYNEEYIKTNRALGELGHPDTPTLNLERVSHKIVSLDEDGNTFYGKAKILDTPYGQIVKNFIENDVSIGVSSRALGSVIQTKEGYNLVQDDLKLATAADIVADPSAPGAFVQGIMENKEWMLVDGKFVEADFDYTKKQIKSASKQQIEEVALKLFENYLRKF